MTEKTTRKLFRIYDIDVPTKHGVHFHFYFLCLFKVIPIWWGQSR